MTGDALEIGELVDAVGVFTVCVGQALDIVDAELAEPFDEHTELLARRIRAALNPTTAAFPAPAPSAAEPEGPTP